MNPFAQIITEYANLIPAAVAFAGLSGLVIAGVGLRMISVAKLTHQPSTKGYWAVMSGAILVNVALWLSGFSQTFIATSAPSTLVYASAGTGANSFVPFALDTVQIFGWFGFIRGAMNLKNEAGEIGHGGKLIPIGQMVFGSLAANPVVMLHAIGNTIGGQLQSFINSVIQ